jgi:hypothetical protein
LNVPWGRKNSIAGNEIVCRVIKRFFEKKKKKYRTGNKPAGGWLGEKEKVVHLLSH